MTDHAPALDVAGVIRALETSPQADPRTDIDTASLLDRFPHLSTVQVSPFPVTGDAGTVPARLYRTAAAPRAAFVWVHGGAFIAGDLDMPESHWVALELASRGIAVVALDYRKALHGVRFPRPPTTCTPGGRRPRHPCPTGPVWRWSSCRLGGASAGANLAAGVALRLRDTPAAARPVSLVLVYPLLHAQLPEASADAAAAVRDLPADARFPPQVVRDLNLNYVGDSGALTNPVAFPGLADPAGLPPVLIENAERDDLRASGEGFAKQLREAGVTVDDGFRPGATHGHLDQPGLAAAVDSIERMARWLLARH